MLDIPLKNILTALKNRELPIAKLAILIIIIAGVILRIKIYLFNQGLWGDELALVYYNFMKKSFLELFQPLNNNQVAPPLFLITTKFFFEMGRSINAWLYADLGAKFFPFICSFLSVFGFYFLLNKVFKNKIYIAICTLLFCFNPIALSYTQEVKQYSTDLLFSILLIYTFYSINFKQDSIKKISIYSLILLISIWFSTSAIFVITAGFCYLIFDFIKNKTYDKKFLFFAIPFAVNFLIWYFIYYLPVKELNYEYMFNFWGKEAQKFLVYDVFGIFNHELKALTSFNYILPALGVGILILIYKKELKILALTILPVIFCSMASYMYFYPFELRLILFLLPSIIIVSTSFLLLIEENKKNVFAIFIFTLITTALQFEHSVSENIYFKTSVRKQVEYIIKNRNKFEKIYTFHIPEFEYYSKILNMNLKCISLYYPFEKEKADLFVNSLEKNKTHLLLIPTLAGLSEEFPINMKTYMKNNEKVEIIETIAASNNGNFYIMKFRTK